MNEETIELADGDVIEVLVLDSNDALIHRVDVPLASLQGQTDWSILQQEDFEVRTCLVACLTKFLTILDCSDPNSIFGNNKSPKRRHRKRI